MTHSSTKKKESKMVMRSAKQRLTAPHMIGRRLGDPEPSRVVGENSQTLPKPQRRDAHPPAKSTVCRRRQARFRGGHGPAILAL